MKSPQFRVINERTSGVRAIKTIYICFQLRRVSNGIRFTVRGLSPVNTFGRYWNKNPARGGKFSNDTHILGSKIGKVGRTANVTTFRRNFLRGGVYFDALWQVKLFGCSGVESVERCEADRFHGTKGKKWKTQGWAIMRRTVHPGNDCPIYIPRDWIDSALEDYPVS